jgi:hypothetical protein
MKLTWHPWREIIIKSELEDLEQKQYGLKD